MSSTLPLGSARGPLIADGIGKDFDGHWLWADLSFSLSPGTMTAITGQSGAGKTTLANCLGLLEPLSTGRLTYDDRRIESLSRRAIAQLYRTTFGFMFQNFALVEQWTIRKNLAVALENKNLRGGTRRQRVSAALHEVGLGGREQDPIHMLSGGEQQRVAFARLILHRPQIVVVDEPSASLDETNSATIVAMLRTLADDGAIVVISTHDTSVSSACDQLIDLAGAAHGTEGPPPAPAP